MKVTLKRDCMIAGAAHAAGAVVDCSDKDAGFLLTRGFAQEMTEETKQKKKAKR